MVNPITPIYSHK